MDFKTNQQLQRFSDFRKTINEYKDIKAALETAKDQDKALLELKLRSKANQLLQYEDDFKRHDPEQYKMIQTQKEIGRKRLEEIAKGKKDLVDYYVNNEGYSFEDAVNTVENHAKDPRFPEAKPGQFDRYINQVSVEDALKQKLPAEEALKVAEEKAGMSAAERKALSTAAKAGLKKMIPIGAVIGGALASNPAMAAQMALEPSEIGIDEAEKIPEDRTFNFGGDNQIQGQAKPDISQNPLASKMGNIPQYEKGGLPVKDKTQKEPTDWYKRQIQKNKIESILAARAKEALKNPEPEMNFTNPEIEADLEKRYGDSIIPYIKESDKDYVSDIANRKKADIRFESPKHNAVINVKNGVITATDRDTGEVKKINLDTEAPRKLTNTQLAQSFKRTDPENYNLAKRYMKGRYDADMRQKNIDEANAQDSVLPTFIEDMLLPKKEQGYKFADGGRVDKISDEEIKADALNKLKRYLEMKSYVNDGSEDPNLMYDMESGRLNFDSKIADENPFNEDSIKLDETPREYIEPKKYRFTDEELKDIKKKQDSGETMMADGGVVKGFNPQILNQKQAEDFYYKTRDELAKLNKIDMSKTDMFTNIMNQKAKKQQELKYAVEQLKKHSPEMFNELRNAALQASKKTGEVAAKDAAEIGIGKTLTKGSKFLGGPVATAAMEMLDSSDVEAAEANTENLKTPLQSAVAGFASKLKRDPELAKALGVTKEEKQKEFPELTKVEADAINRRERENPKFRQMMSESRKDNYDPFVGSLLSNEGDPTYPKRENAIDDKSFIDKVDAISNRNKPVVVVPVRSSYEDTSPEFQKMKEDFLRRNPNQASYFGEQKRLPGKYEDTSPEFKILKDQYLKRHPEDTETFNYADGGIVGNIYRDKLEVQNKFEDGGLVDQDLSLPFKEGIYNNYKKKLIDQGATPEQLSAFDNEVFAQTKFRCGGVVHKGYAKGGIIKDPVSEILKKQFSPINKDQFKPTSIKKLKFAEGGNVKDTMSEFYSKVKEMNAAKDSQKLPFDESSIGINKQMKDELKNLELAQKSVMKQVDHLNKVEKMMPNSAAIQEGKAIAANALEKIAQKSNFVFDTLAKNMSKVPTLKHGLAMSGPAGLAFTAADTALASEDVGQGSDIVPNVDYNQQQKIARQVPNPAILPKFEDGGIGMPNTMYGTGGEVKHDKFDALLASGQMSPDEYKLAQAMKNCSGNKDTRKFDGDNYVGDRVDAKVNDGEMVLNLDSQQRVMDALQGKEPMESIKNQPPIVRPATQDETNLHRKLTEQELRLQALEKMLKR